MTPTVELVPMSEHGDHLLDRFEEATGARPCGSDQKGARRYDLAAERMPVAFDLALEAVDPEWSEHIAWAATSDVRE